MHFEWDPRKDKSNQIKHGLSFDEARRVFDDPFQLAVLDHRFSYFEERWITIGRIGDKRLVVVAHLYFNTEGEEVIRIISAREATVHERKEYEKP
jgi:uncharacterized DUF497 family protein